jgi:hypothetical protein
MTSMLYYHTPHISASSFCLSLTRRTGWLNRLPWFSAVYPVLHLTPPASTLYMFWFSAQTRRLHHSLIIKLYVASRCLLQKQQTSSTRQTTLCLTTFNLTLVCPPGAFEALHPTCCHLPQKPSAGLHIRHSFTPNPGTIVRPQRYAARPAPAQHSSQPLAAGAAIRAAAAATPTHLGVCYSRAG